MMIEGSCAEEEKSEGRATYPGLRSSCGALQGLPESPVYPCSGAFHVARCNLWVETLTRVTDIAAQVQFPKGVCWCPGLVGAATRYCYCSQ